MLNAPETTALEKLLRPLSQRMTIEVARALAEIEADAETQARYDELADRHTEGRLTAEERTELEALVRANTFLGLLKAEARLFLTRKPAS